MALTHGKAIFEPANQVCMTGDLADWSLIELLTWLHEEHATGMLRLGHSLGAGIIFVIEGSVVRCEQGPLAGETALAQMASRLAGPFLLMLRQPPDARANIQRPTADLLVALRRAETRIQAAHSRAS